MKQPKTPENRASFSIREVAEQHGVHPRTVRRMIDRGELKVVRFGAVVRIPKSELERLAGGA